MSTASIYIYIKVESAPKAGSALTLHRLEEEAALRPPFRVGTLEMQQVERKEALTFCFPWLHGLPRKAE